MRLVLKIEPHFINKSLEKTSLLENISSNQFSKSIVHESKNVDFTFFCHNLVKEQCNAENIPCPKNIS